MTGIQRALTDTRDWLGLWNLSWRPFETVQLGHAVAPISVCQLPAGRIISECDCTDSYVTLSRQSFSGRFRSLADSEYDTVSMAGKPHNLELPHGVSRGYFTPLTSGGCWRSGTQHHSSFLSCTD